MLGWFEKNKLVDRDAKWRMLLKELYTERELLKRERNAFKKEVARLQAICDCQSELLGGANENYSS